MRPSRSHHPSGLLVAVAVISAVMVLAGFSYATSRLVGMVRMPVTHAQDPRYVAADKTTPSREPSLVEIVYREDRGIDRRWLMPVDVRMEPSGPAGSLRGAAPQGRPLVLWVSGNTTPESLLFESLSSSPVHLDVEGAACLPPLERGAYPFFLVPGELDGLLLIE